MHALTGVDDAALMAGHEADGRTSEGREGSKRRGRGSGMEPARKCAPVDQSLIFATESLDNEVMAAGEDADESPRQPVELRVAGAVRLLWDGELAGVLR